jgi:hypothetical protein
MKFLCKSLILFLSIASAQAADKEGAVFEAGPASSYEHRQTISELTIAAKVYGGRDEIKSVFGRVDPTAHGVLPILVVMANDSGQTLSLEQMRIEYIRKDRYRVPSTPANEVRYLYGARRPQTVPQPSTRRLPIPGLGGNRDNNPLAAEEIELRAFGARMLPPGDSASGFIYFHTASHAGSVLYITGIREPATGQELFFFEIPLD